MFHREFNTVAVAQLVRASDCDSEGRGFESPQPPLLEQSYFMAVTALFPTTKSRHFSGFIYRAARIR